MTLMGEDRRLGNGGGRTARRWLARLIAVVVLLGAAGPALIEAAVYKCVAPDGSVSFQETTCDGMAPGGQTTQVLRQGWPSGGKHIFWQATGQRHKIYLLGSLHFGVDTMYPLPQVITDALASADALAVEANVTAIPPVELAAKIARSGLYHDGTHLSDVLGNSNWRALNALSRTTGVPEAELDRQKPWLASMTLVSAALQQLGYSPELGVDLQLMKGAGSRIPIVELESADFQFSLFNRMAQEDQVAMLLQTMHQIRDAERNFSDLLEAWMSGDVDTLERLIAEGFDTTMQGRSLYNSMIRDRNAAMVASITQLIRRYDVLFVVVGAGHMVGEEGIVARMKAIGYKVEQL